VPNPVSNSQRVSHPSAGSKPVSSHTSTTSSTGTAPASNTTTMDRAARERAMKKEKERFLIFTRVLLKYLEQKDPELHVKVKAIIKECAERNKRQERGYESVTASMRTRLREVVSDQYWKRAEAYLQHFLQQKQRQSSSSGTHASSSSSDPKSSQDNTARQKAEMDRRRQIAQMQARNAATKQQQQQQQQATAAASSRAPPPAHMRPDNTNKRQQQQQPPPSKQSMNPPQQMQKTPASSSGQAQAYAAASSAKLKAQAATGATAARPSSTGRGGKASASPVNPRGSTPATKTDTATIKADLREYSEFMEMVDNTVDFDWTAAGLLLGQNQHSHLTEEQRKLLYNSSEDPQVADVDSGLGFPMAGWSKRNVISSRVAWARVRLRELRVMEQEAATPNPLVGGGLLTLPSTTPNADADKKTTVKSNWVNEDVAEDDLALAAISEGAEILLKGILEKAIHCSRQRQNVDGIRLWHQQMVPSNDGSRPPLSLRLGCDVSRQVARAEGNAALTCKRMEEALARRQQDLPGCEWDLQDKETFSKANSMSELAIRPLLANGAEDADVEAKRCFEVYGGKEAGEPVFGRVPKRAKLEVVDFQLGMNFADHNHRQRAETLSGSFAF
jgi:hypothetical protein